MEFTKLDDFEDAAAWMKGDPKTDLDQKTRPSLPARIRQGGQESLAFLNRINWTPRGDEKYPKGWPMISRKFDPAQDWSGQTTLLLALREVQPRRLPSRLKVGVRRPEKRDREVVIDPARIRQVAGVACLAIEGQRRRSGRLARDHRPALGYFSSPRGSS